MENRNGSSKVYRACRHRDRGKQLQHVASAGRGSNRSVRRSEPSEFPVHHRRRSALPHHPLINNPEVHTPNLDRLADGARRSRTAFIRARGAARSACPVVRCSTADAPPSMPRTALMKCRFGARLLAPPVRYLHLRQMASGPPCFSGFKEMGPVAPGMLASTPEGGAAYDRPRPGDDWQPWDESLEGSLASYRSVEERES